jgi:multiple sugar transport system substrate-binding protein
MWGSPEEIETHQKVADAYMAANPNVTIELWAQPWGDYFTKLQTLWAAGDGEAIPDVLFLSPVPAYAADGVLENLDPFIAASGMDVNDYWPGALKTTSFEDHVYGFPRDIGMEVLYYNKDHFDEAGLDYPDENWAWDDLRAAAEALTITAASGRVERYGLGMEGGKYPQFLLSNGGGMFDDTFNPTECWLSKPESIAGVEFIAGMMNDEIAMRDANLNQAGGDSAVFQSEQVSMIVQNASRVPAFNSAGMNNSYKAWRGACRSTRRRVKRSLRCGQWPSRRSGWAMTICRPVARPGSFKPKGPLPRRLVSLPSGMTSTVP